MPARMDAVGNANATTMQPSIPAAGTTRGGRPSAGVSVHAAALATA